MVFNSRGTNLFITFRSLFFSLEVEKLECLQCTILFYWVILIFPKNRNIWALLLYFNKFVYILHNMRQPNETFNHTTIYQLLFLWGKIFLEPN